jgi:anti-sigma regulatory factor (Ser/Thr protein kinase)
VAYAEAATNALKHAGSGSCQLFRRGGTVQVAVSDTGPGIDFRLLPKATLLPGFSSAQSLGMGFTIMLDLSDRILLATAPGRTRVVLEFAVAASGHA